MTVDTIRWEKGDDGKIFHRYNSETVSARLVSECEGHTVFVELAFADAALADETGEPLLAEQILAGVNQLLSYEAAHS